MSAKYDKAPARKIGVINKDKAVTGTQSGDRLALDTRESNINIERTLDLIYLELQQINKNLKILNDIEFEEKL